MELEQIGQPGTNFVGYTMLRRRRREETNNDRELLILFNKL
jgi:hypothetical protein